MRAAANRCRGRVHSMRCLVRAGFAAALVAFVFSPALAADKAFKQSGLDEAAIKLEAQIKSDAGNVTKPAATLRRDADAAFQKNDFRAGMLVLGQLVAAAPDDAASWLRLARTVLQIKPRDDREKTLLLDRAVDRRLHRLPARAATATSKPTAWRCSAGRSPTASSGARALDAMRLSLELRETADLRGQYEKLRAEHGFRLLDYTVDSDVDFAARLLPVLRGAAGQAHRLLALCRRCRASDRPAISASEKQLCVEGLKHGERYADHAARRPAVGRQETLAKSAEFTIFVRDRKPFVRFSGKAYVLPRTGQRGIPVLSVNTQAVTLVDLSHRRPQSRSTRFSATTSSAT